MMTSGVSTVAVNEETKKSKLTAAAFSSGMPDAAFVTGATSTSDEAVKAEVADVRMVRDQHGLIAFVEFRGCPLNCRYCRKEYRGQAPDISVIDTKPMFPANSMRSVTPAELLEWIYKEVPAGLFCRGLLLGGGEPLFYADFIRQMAREMPDSWALRIETTLNIDWKQVEKLTALANQWIVKVIDWNPAIYLRYTGRSNTKVRENLKHLSGLYYDYKDRILIRVPLIPGVNTPRDCRETTCACIHMGTVERYTDPASEATYFKERGTEDRVRIRTLTDDWEMKLRLLRKQSLEELDLSTRAYNALRRAGLATIGDLCSKTEEEVRTIRNLGQRSMAEILVKLDEIGLRLKAVERI
ncbi:MAG: DNA-directed RNA polymerase subunit alpha C-terminal domain-containing protein [Eubacterium sp.]|nr:DNA-directed RNA polymerase subunit alpha C-terminal domain-containing protein [Eubacterium sp.]